MQNNITILVNSCDSYEDAWLPFFKLFSVYWADCAYPIILNTESKTYSFSPLSIQCLRLYQPWEQVSYSKRFLDHLNRVKTKYTLVLLDDFFLRSPVDTQRIEQCRQWMDENEKIAVFSFESVADAMNQPSAQYPDYELRPQVGEYKLNLQAGLWRTDKLISYVRAHESPWEFETIGNFRTFRTKDEFYSIRPYAPRPLDYGFDVKGMGIYRGKWVLPTVEELFREHQIEVDFSTRGIYKPEDQSSKREMENKSHGLRDIRSLGLRFYCEILFWRIKRQIRKRVGQPCEKDYIEYLRKRRI